MRLLKWNVGRARFELLWSKGRERKKSSGNTMIHYDPISSVNNVLIA